MSSVIPIALCLIAITLIPLCFVAAILMRIGIAVEDINNNFKTFNENYKIQLLAYGHNEQNNV